MVKKAETVFDNKIWKSITGILFPVILVLFSLMHIGEGVTVTDTGYNYGNFVFFDSLDDMWKFSTYLAGALGALFTRLPFGQTMLGLNFYTGLIKVAVALLAYYFCVRVCKMRKEVVFAGEMLALGLCWCPTALTYNYLTYFLFSAGAMLLYAALVKEKNVYFVLAGVALGLNVFVRLPNLAEMALIVVVWLCGILYRQKTGKVIKNTLLCVLGYIIGLACVFVYIICRYGLNRYMDGISALFAMTDEAGSYTVKAMIVDMIKVYLQYIGYFAGGLLLVAIGMILFKVFDKKFMAVKCFFYTAVVLAVVILYYKLGMFNFNYRAYTSMFGWGVILLTFCLALGAFWILFTKKEKEEKIMAAIVCVIILITPLGSNNHLYSPMNNLFLVAPFFINYIWYLLSGQKSCIMVGKVEFSTVPYKITIVILGAAVWLQSVIFGANFVFRDGVNGEARNAQVEENAVLTGMYTTQENAENLQELNSYLEENELVGKDAILFGNVPALAFYYELTPALSSTWPDLQSFAFNKFEAEINELAEEGKRPVVVMSSNPADVGKDEGAKDSLMKKMQCLENFMTENSYKQGFSNDAFTVYISR